MSERVNRAKLYRYRAEQLRRMRENWRNPETLEKLERLACEYDQMAEDIEAGEASATGRKAG